MPQAAAPALAEAVAGSPLREVRALAVFALGQSTAAAPALVAPVRKTAAPGHIRVQLGVGGRGS